jgi:hypothetical protein
MPEIIKRCLILIGLTDHHSFRGIQLEQVARIMADLTSQVMKTDHLKRNCENKIFKFVV